MKDDVSPATDATSTVESRRAIDTFLESMGHLSRGQVSDKTFYTVLLRGAATLLRAHAGVAWMVHCDAMPASSEQRSAEVVHAWDDDRLFSSAAKESIACEAQRVGQLTNSASAPIRLGEPAATFVAFVATYSSLPSERRALAFYVRHPLPADASAGCLRFVTALAQIADQFHQTARVRQEPTGSWRELETLIRKLQTVKSTRDAAYELANETRRLVQCDRVFVLLRRAGAYRAVACSGVDWIDRHASLATDLGKLVTTVAPLKQVWSTDGDLRAVAPEISQYLEPYLDQSTVRHLAIVPMQSAEENGTPKGSLPIGMFAFENLVDRPVEYNTPLVSALAHHAQVGITESARRASWLVRAALALTHPWQRWFRDRRMPRTLLVGVVGAAVVGSALMWPVTFRVSAEGVLVPDSRKYVFASHNGFLDEVLVAHGDKVAEGQPVARITSPELELEARRLLGDLQTTQEELAATTAERFQVTGVDQRSVQRAGELTAQEGSLKERELSLREQLAIVKQQEEQLVLRSSISGVVVDWNVQQRLLRRPVQRGQVILQVADLSGPWSLELQVPDEAAGHVLESAASSPQPLAVSFVVNQDPEVTHVGTLVRHSVTTQEPRDKEPYVEMQVTLQQQDFVVPRADAQVTAKIHCGRRRLGFVLFHEIIEELRRTFF